MYKYKDVCLEKINGFYHKQLYDAYLISYALYKNDFVWKTQHSYYYNHHVIDTLEKDSSY